MNKKPYRNVLSAAQASLNAGIEQIRSSIPHAGETGTLIEKLFRSELKKVLPEKVAVADGFVVDADGRASKQMDIILYDKLNTPRIFSSDGAQMFPVETTYAAGEIKTRLDTSSLRDTYEKCSSYKSLVRKAYFGPNQPRFFLFGKWHENWQSIFFCIAVESMNVESLRDKSIEIVKEKNLTYNNRVDAICSLDGNFLLNLIKPPNAGVLQDQSIDLLPDPTNRFGVYSAMEPWTLFIFLLIKYMAQAPQLIVNMLPYDNGQPF